MIIDNKNNNYIIIDVNNNIKYINQRIDKFISNNIKTFTRSNIQELLVQKQIFILINNNEVKNINKNYKIKGFEKIFIKKKPKLLNFIKPQKILLNIIYEDEYIIVINKNKNMVVHPAPGNYNNTLVNALIYFYKNKLSSIDLNRPGIIHRLDKDTSGLIMIAKNNLIHNYLTTSMQYHKIKRIYEAIIIGNLLNNQGIIDKPIFRGKIDKKKMIITSLGKKSITFYKSIKKYINFEHIKFQLQTGRTHQIRIHMSSINHPILGDMIYGNKIINQEFPNLIGQCLHAKSIIFNHPITNKLLNIKTILPKYFINILETINNY